MGCMVSGKASGQVPFPSHKKQLSCHALLQGTVQDHRQTTDFLLTIQTTFLSQLSSLTNLFSQSSLRLYDFAMCSVEPQLPFFLLLSVVKMDTCSNYYCPPLFPKLLMVDINVSGFIF